MIDETFLPRRPIPAHVTKNANGATCLRVAVSPCISGVGLGYTYQDFTLAISPGPLQRQAWPKALLHPMPRAFKLKEGLECHVLSVITSELERRAWEGEAQPSSTKRRNGCSDRDRKKAHSVRTKAAKLFNHLWKRVVAESAHPEARRIALRFPPSARWGIYQECALSERFRQLCEAFPLLAAAIAKEQGFERSDLINAVEDGQPLRDIADRLNLPLHLRRLHPCCATLLSHERWPTAQMMQFCPRQALKQYRWMRAFVELSEYEEDKKLRAWMAQRADTSLRATALALMAGQIRDWFRENPSDEPRFSWATAVERTNAWHREIVLRQADQAAKFDKESSELAKQPFVEPWLAGGPFGVFELVPLRNAAELTEEGQLMGHCVGSYARLVRQGYCYIYGVRQGAERVATLELQRDGTGLRIAQLHGPRNAEPSPAVKSATRRWFAKRTTVSREAPTFQLQEAV